MAESILKLRVDSQEYESKIKRAAVGIQRMAEACHKAGSTLNVLEDENRDFIRSLGNMETVSKTARGKISELTAAFTDLKSVYNAMSAAEKNGEVGRELNKQLEIMKGRILEGKRELQEIGKELQGGNGKFGQFGNIIDGIGQKMGINANLTELLTSRTALLTGAIGVSTTAVIAAANAWAEYNSEIAKQQHITTVTTGMKGDEADRMTAAARALSKTYNVDFRESINAANTLMSQFGATGDEAIRLLRDGMRGMILGDGPKLLSMIQQYAPAFRDAGVSASQLVAVIQNSEGGIFTAENMSAIVMGIKNIRLMTKSTSDALAQLGIDGKAMTQSLNDGTLTIFDALKQVAGQLKNVDSNSQAAGQVMQAVFGRQGAMAGTNLAKAIEGLNTDLETTKRQTGEVGESFDHLYRANVRLEQALKEAFGYKGWEEMATGIKTKLIVGMAATLELTNKIKDALYNSTGKTLFDVMADGALRTMGPLGTVLRLLKDINKEKGGETGGGTGTTKNEDFEYIKGGTTKQEREDRYSKVLDDINKNLAEIGKEKTRKNADGSTSFYIDSPEKQQEQRQQLLNQRTQLVLNRDNLLRGQSNQLTPVTPIVPEPKTPKGTTNTPNTQKTEEQLNNEEIQKLTQEYIKATDERRAAIRAEIKDLQDKNKVIKQLTEEAQGLKFDEGSLNALNEELKKLQTERGKLSDPIEIEIQDQQIKEVQDEIDRLNGKKVTVDIEANIQDLRTSFERLQDSIKLELSAKNVDVDKNTLKSLTEVVTKYDIQTGTVDMSKVMAQTDELTKSGMEAGAAYAKALQDAMVANLDLSTIQQRIGEEIDIPDETWQKLQDEINAKLKEMNIEPIHIDLKTGNFSNKNAQGNKNPYLSKNEDGNMETKINDILGGISGGIGQIASGIEQMGIEIPEGLKQGLSAVQGVSTILTGIATTLLAIEAIAGADAIIPFANGGVVHAEGGWGGYVPGNHFSGDKVPALLNSGELVLNKFQQEALAGTLQNAGGGGDMKIVGVLSGENVVLMADRWGRRTGRGELLFGKNL